MITAILSFLLVLLVYWMFQIKIRELLWRDLSDIPQKPVDLIIKTIKTQLMTLSPRNIFFQSQVDLELGLKSYREALLLLCMNRLSVVLIGTLILVSLNQLALVALVLLGGILLFLLSKNLKSVLQVVLLAASVLVIYQFSFFSISRWIYSTDEMSFVFVLADARWPSLLLMFISAITITWLFKFEFAILILSSLLFFSGTLPLTNAMALIFGETLGWVLLFTYWSHHQSRFGKRLLYEILFLTFISGLLVLSFLLITRGYGLSSFRVMGGLEDKKILFIGTWALLEFVTTGFLMIWGHFRFQMISSDPTEVEPLYFSRIQFRKSGWISQQTNLRLEKAQNKLESLQKSKSELTIDEQKLIPKPFMKKLIIEVETLKSLIEQLRAHT